MSVGVELSYALTWMVGASALFGTIRALPSFRANIHGWFYVNLALLLVVVLGVIAKLEGLGYVAGALWFTFVILPSHLSRRRQEALHALDFSRAWRWAKAVAILHPFDNNREQQALLASHHHEAQGRLDVAKATLKPLLCAKAWAEQAKLELLRLDHRWDEIVEHLRRQAPGTRQLRYASLYLRALGETHEVEAMWVLYGQLPPPFAAQPVIRLQVATLTGLVDLLDPLLERHFAAMPASFRGVWRGSAFLAQGNTDGGKELLQGIVKGSLPGHALASRRLEHPLAPVKLTELSTETLHALKLFRSKLQQEASSAQAVKVERRPYATLGLLGLLALVFLLTVLGGARDVDNLVRLGVLVLPSELVGGEVTWRVVTAGFLHLGATHWGFNSLGLWLLGRQIEQIWNATTLLLVFLGSSIGSFAFAALTVHATLDAPRVFLGASAGVMGLVGALGTFFLSGFCFRRSTVLGKRFLSVLTVLAMQLVFDWFTPQVSSRLHLSGFVLGALVAVPFAVKTWKHHPSFGMGVASQSAKRQV